MSKIRLLLGLILLPCLNMWARANVKDTILTFDSNEFAFESVSVHEKNVGSYVKIRYKGKQGQVSYVETPGCPELPVFHITVPLSHNVENVKVSGDAGRVQTLALDYPVLPVQHPIATGVGYEKPQFCIGDSIAYSEKYPSSVVALTDVSCLGNKEKFVGINVSPIIYYPTENKCELIESVSIRISYTLRKEKAAARLPIIECPPTSLPFYEYCVITPRKFKKSFDRLVGWERQKGLNAGVVCTEDILSDVSIKGDTVSNIYDDAGKIRQYLQYAYKYGGAHYVLFGGNDSIVPIRYGTGMNNTYQCQNDAEALHIPSDFYFAELNSNWNKDRDSFYGEPVDLEDYAAELEVGRLLCTKAEDIDNYTDKLLRYELYPGRGDFSYLRKAFYSQADQMQKYSQAVQIASDLKEVFPNSTVVSEKPSFDALITTYPTGNDVVDTLKKHFGFVSWFNHGHPMTVTVKTDTIGRNPYGLSSVTGDIPWIEKETCNGLDSLGNKDYPMVAYSISCSITPFDIYKKEYGYKTNMGQSFTLGKDYGGPALIGNTRVGWVGTSYKMQMVFNRFFPTHSIGEALNLAKLSNSNRRHHHALVVNVIGTPDLNIWTDIPQRFNAVLSGSKLDSSTEEWLYVGRYDLRNGVSCIDKCTLSSGGTLIDGTDNCVLTLMKRNWLPQILPIVLKGIEVTGTNNIISTDTSVGSLENTGDAVKFVSGSNTTIEKSGEFRIVGNTVIEKGAIFAVRNSTVIE